MEIVSRIRSALVERIGQARYDLWFGAETRLSCQDSLLVVEAATPFRLDRLRNSFRGDLDAARATGSGLSSIEFRVEPKLGTVASSAPHNQSSATPMPSAAMPHRAAATEGRSSADSVHGNARAATFERPLAKLDEFVVGDGNALAASSAGMVVERLGAMSPLVVHGPTGVGKTHLLEGILHAVRRQTPQRRAISLAAEQFTSLFLQALHGRGLPSFRQKYRGVELFILDDLQFFANKQATLVELLHTIDNLQRAGKQIVLAADRSPDELGALLGREFVARLAGGLSCPIEAPDYATRRGILERAAREQRLELPADLLHQLADQLPGDARRLRGAIHRLAALAHATGKSPTSAAAQTALADLLRTGNRLVRLPDIERAVCDAFGVAPEELHSAKKSKQVSQPRMFAMWLARKLTRAGLTEIGSFFGRKSHSTVVSAQKKIDALRARGTSVQLAETSCDIHEALRRLESRLRTG